MPNPLLYEQSTFGPVTTLRRARLLWRADRLQGSIAEYEPQVERRLGELGLTIEEVKPGHPVLELTLSQQLDRKYSRLAKISMQTNLYNLVDRVDIDEMSYYGGWQPYSRELFNSDDPRHSTMGMWRANTILKNAQFVLNSGDIVFPRG